MSKLGEVGKLSLLIKDPTGNPISTARVDFSMNGKLEKPIPAYPDADGLVELLLPTGEWKFSIKDNGRESTGSTLHVKKEGIAQKEISMGVQSGIHFNVTKKTDPLRPAKLRSLESKALKVQGLDQLTGLMAVWINFIQKMVPFPLGYHPVNTKLLSPGNRA